MIISFYSPSYKETKAYPLYVFNCGSKNVILDPEIADDEEILQKILESYENTNKINLQELSPDSLFDFSTYPNPNDGYFTLMLDAKEVQNFFVEIFNSSGIIVSKKEYHNTHQVNVEHKDLSPGVYFVKLSMGTNVSVKKVVINQ